MKLDPRLKAALGEIDQGGSMVLEADGTPAVICRLPVFTTKDVPVGFGEMQFADYTPEGPIAVLVFRWFDAPTDPLIFEMFLDPSNGPDRRLLTALSVYLHIRMYVFSAEPGMAYLGAKQLTWRDQHRAGAARILEATAGRRTLWPAAKQRYQREHAPGDLS